MNVAVIGTGYVGLVTGACLASAGNNVICVDTNEAKIEMLLSGDIPIWEPGLDDLVCEGYTLDFTTDIARALDGADVCFIAVGTPEGDDGRADMKYVYQVANSIGEHMTDYLVVVDKSTVPVGTADRVAQTISSVLRLRGEDIPFDVVSNPEFLKEGSAINDFMKPDRVVIGTDSDRAWTIMKRLYRPFSRSRDKIIRMGIKDAEMTKYAANAMLATKISFINEIANICDAVGADVENVRLGIGSDSRIGYSFIYPGCGYGGSCFPKDVVALAKTAADAGYNAQLIQTVDKVNDEQKYYVADKVESYCEAAGLDLHDLTIAIWGIAFKPNTDDTREAPFNYTTAYLMNAGAKVNCYDPVAELPNDFQGDIAQFDDKYECLENADMLLIMTEWQEFRNPDWTLIANTLNFKLIFDGRNMYDPEEMTEMGFRYYGVGRKN